MRHTSAALVATLMSTSAMMVVAAAPSAEAAGSCVYETHRSQYWDFTWKTKQNGMKVTCPSAGSAQYQMVITCEDRGTYYGNWVSQGQTSYALCKGYYDEANYYARKVTNYYIRTR